MNYHDYQALSSEINELNALLAEIPEENIIERKGLESRLASAKRLIAGVNEQQLGHKARLLFRGKPVFGTHGIAADFAAKAAGAFAEAVTVVAASLSESLQHSGPIPDKQKNQLLITGTAVGSFGFEFELPQSDDPQPKLYPEQSASERALEKVQALLQQSVDGSDDAVAELVDEIHPRAVRKVADFLSFIFQQEAWCGLEFKDRSFRYEGIEQLKSSVERLREENIREAEQSFAGEFQGVLPGIRNFEFKCSDQEAVIRGKVGSGIEDADILNRTCLHRPVTAKFQVIQVGHGRPRYTLKKLEDITEYH